MRKRLSRKTRGFTIIELMVSLVIATIIVMGMGMVLVTLFTGMRESRDFFEATSRVDLIRQLTFDARTGNSIRFPATDGTPGDYASGGFVGDQIQFDALQFDPDANAGAGETTTVTITWESRRPSAAPLTDPYSVFRFIDVTPEFPTSNPSDDVQTFGQSGINYFDVVRVADDSFTVSMETEQGDETVQVELAVTMRNVIQ